MAIPPPPTYVILGATGGIGSALSWMLTNDGANLIVAGRDQSRTDRLAGELNARSYTIDARKYEEVEACIKYAGSTFGSINGIVNCVGSLLLKPAHITSLDEWHETVAVNLNSAFYTVKAGARAMMKTGGSIVLVTSAAARTGLNNHEAIAAAKGGIIGLTRSAAATYAPRGIRVNAVAPGLVKSKLTEHLVSNDASRQASLNMHALGRLGEPFDVAVAMRWLLNSTQSGWVTGQIIGIDGGLATVRPK